MVSLEARPDRYHPYQAWESTLKVTVIMGGLLHKVRDKLEITIQFPNPSEKFFKNDERAFHYSENRPSLL